MLNKTSSHCIHDAVDQSRTFTVAYNDIWWPPTCSLQVPRKIVASILAQNVQISRMTLQLVTLPMRASAELYSTIRHCHRTSWSVYATGDFRQPDETSHQARGERSTIPRAAAMRSSTKGRKMETTPMMASGSCSRERKTISLAITQRNPFSHSGEVSHGPWHVTRSPSWDCHRARPWKTSTPLARRRG